MKKYLIYLFALSILVISFGCNVEDKANDDSATGLPIFVPGKGLNPIWTMNSETEGLGQFYNSHLTYSNGSVQMLIAYKNADAVGTPAEYDLYRKKINLLTRAAVDLPLEEFALNPLSIIEENGNVFLIPHTDLLAYIYNIETIKGEANWLPVSGFGYYIPKIYENQQIAMSHYTPSNNKINATIFVNGVYTSDQKVINASNYCSSLDLTTDATPLIFTAGKPTLQAYNYSTNTQLASIPITLYDDYVSTVPQNTKMTTKRSKDGTKIIGLISDSYQNGPKTYTSFVYDIATKRFTIKVDKKQRQGTYLNGVEDFDEQGNIYYTSSQGMSYQIKKITPDMEVVFRSDFISGGSILNIKAIDDKVFVVLGLNGNNVYTGERGKGQIILTVAD